MTDAATRAQIEAASPRESTWLTANAGSGKTSVLTDRVARLLLEGTPPERILCLTYTKAAAGEMQNRLLRRLGEWAMLPDAVLVRQLARMGAGTGDLPAARRLFARAIEAPGGLKVQTIHAFCAAILRRFPLEAGVPPGFAELDERSAANLRAEIVERMAEDRAPEIADLVTLHSDHGLDRFLAAITGPAARFELPPDRDALWGWAGLPAGFDTASLIAGTLGPGDRDLLAELMDLLPQGSTNDRKLRDALAGGNWDAPGLAELALLERQLLFGEKTAAPFAAKLGAIPTKALRNGCCAHLLADLEALMGRVESARGRRIALAFCEGSAALHRFAHAFATRYAEAKRGEGWLDFDDLITRTATLLSRSSMAQWVLFRLDGGVDHILVDEAQDTSPAQWQVIARLVAEFTAGAGAREVDRTLFVVGDPKQSIYSFQGADAAVFEARRETFARDFEAGGRPIADRALRHSFRSSPAILSLVDAVFQGDAAEGLGGPPVHVPFRPDQPGRVDLWPAIPRPDAPEPRRWSEPLDGIAPPSEMAVLADAVARRVKAMLGTPFLDIRAKPGPQPRAIEPRDIMILVQRRSKLFDALIRSLKAHHLPVAGADRMKLAGELAVRDIRAVLSVLATSEDDLSLAAALRSPLFGLDEDALYRLAAHRGGYLREALWESRHDAVKAVLHDLRGASQSLRPYDLIARLLIRHDGRARLIERLGTEAEDGIAELMSQALAYEATGTPSLTGFLTWLGEDDIEVKRGPGGAGLIRVMTVHGAKGLESPVVILPDTACRNAPSAPTHLPLPDRPAVLRGRKGQRPPQVEAAVAAEAARAAEERRRLLYVAMTRAESWLIVAAAGETGSGTDSWYAMVEEGFARAGTGLAASDLNAVLPDGPGGRRLSSGTWREVAAEASPLPAPAPLPADHPLRMRPAPVARPARPVAATSLGGAKVVAGPVPEDAPTAEEAMLAGTRLHLLLEHLPGADAAVWPDLARDLLATAEGGLPAPDDLAALLAEVRAVVAAPDLASLFTPHPDERLLREVALAAPLPGVGTVSGAIDRLLVGRDRILAIDYKSNAEVPAAPDAVPDGILRQMAAYRAALRAIWPGRRIEVAVLWTRTRELMLLPDAVLDRTMALLAAA